MFFMTPYLPSSRASFFVRYSEVDAMQTGSTGRLEPAWEKRAQFVANYIPAGARVLAMGGGTKNLEKYLPPGCDYLPCDLVSRDDTRTCVCDFNGGQYPDDQLQSADVVAMMGMAEYIYNLPGLICRLGCAGRPLLVSYCPSDTGATTTPNDRGRVNHYTREQFAGLLRHAGFRLRRCEQMDGSKWLFDAVLESSVSAPAPAKRVLVLSYNNIGNFGDRLGYHLINSLLPAQAVVTHAHFNPWNVPDENFDLLVLGVGNSLFAPLLTDKLLALLDRIPAKIGIFGTQYREDIPRQRMQAVLSRLDHWYARYQEDVFLYGHDSGNVTHLGDWLINAFPLTRGKDGALLRVGAEVLQQLPLDRTIEKIQAHRRVYSTRLHPLLCALTSAEAVAYLEQRENRAATPSGKFRSMLLDVFGRSMPEDRLWEVDREAVATYKSFVKRQTELLRAKMATLL